MVLSSILCGIFRSYFR